MRGLCKSVCLAATLAIASTAHAEAALGPLTSASPTPPAPWHVVGLPQQSKPFTRFEVVEQQGRRVLRIEADASYGNLVHPLASFAAPAHLSWQWRVEQPLTEADLHKRSGDDSAVKVCVFFDEPLESIPFGERQILRIARGRSAEPVPSATVCYVWDAHLPAGTALDNAFTRRVRYLVLESGTETADPASHWKHERRDLGADYTRLFGAESGAVPPIVGIAVGADADNTKSHSLAYVSDLVLEH